MASEPNHALYPLWIFLGIAGVVGVVVEFAKTNLWVALGMAVLAAVAALIRIVQLLSNTEAKSLAQVQKLRTKKIDQYAPWVKSNLRGHDPTVDLVIGDIQRNLSIAHEHRNLGSFLFVGPTGTGKTFFAELLAKVLYPDIEPLLIRMNQLKHTNDVYTLIGPPPGSPGYEVGGLLTRPILEEPKRVVIFDEIEKCHTDLQDTLYDILDTAVCVEKSSAKKVNFSQCVFVGTCNAGAAELRTLKATHPNEATWLSESRDILMRNTRFQKSFLARWDRVILMDELMPLNVAEVACLNICRHWARYGIKVSFTSPQVLLHFVRSNAEFKEYGVRQLESYIQTKTNGAIEKARRDGLREVVLEFSPAGDIYARTGGINAKKIA